MSGAEDGESNESAMRPVEIGEVNAAVAIELPFEYDLSDDVVMQSASMIFLPAITAEHAGAFNTFDYYHLTDISSSSL